MSRRAITKNVLQDLCIRSKNKCAFPGCDHPILNEHGDYVAELCHIEAAEPGGPRYNPNQTDEERRSYSNLLFLCHHHHKETDNVDLYSVERLKAMKAAHEALPEVVFNHELLLQKIEAVAAEQAKVLQLLQFDPPASTRLGPFPIIGPHVTEAWTPEEGRFYVSKDASGSGFKLFFRKGWLHIEQTLPDGAVAYYEIDEQGTVRDSQMPYPINEYRVEIPETLVLIRQKLPSNLGTHAIRTNLKWSAGYVVEHFQGTTFVGADCHARCTIDHGSRVIRVLEPKGA